MKAKNATNSPENYLWRDARVTCACWLGLRTEVRRRPRWCRQVSKSEILLRDLRCYQIMLHIEFHKILCLLYMWTHIYLREKWVKFETALSWVILMQILSEPGLLESWFSKLYIDCIQLFVFTGFYSLNI